MKIILSVLLFVCYQVMASVWYVSTNGSGAGRGTFAKGKIILTSLNEQITVTENVASTNYGAWFSVQQVDK